MNEKQLNHIMSHLAERLVPDEIDLWPAIREQLKASKQHSIKGDLSMNTRFTRSRRMRLAFTFLSVLLVVAVLIVATPQGRALAQGFVQFFSRAGSDFLPAPTEVPLTWVNRFETTPPTQGPLSAPFVNDCGIYVTPKCSVPQIRSKVDFTIKELGTIPDRVSFIGATGGPDLVYILYDTHGHHGFLVLWESPWTGSLEHAFQVGASAVVDTVQIGKNTGQYVKGSFGMMAGDPTVNWDPNADTQTLCWVENGVYIEMQSSGSAMAFDRDQFVMLANTLTTGPVTVRPTPSIILTPTPTLDVQAMFNTVYPLTLLQARDKAGFELLQPTRLPAILTFQGAAYDTNLQIVRIFYLTDQGMATNTNGLLLAEKRIDDPSDCGICSFIKGDVEPFDSDKYSKIVPNFTTVQIGGITGEYTAGDWENYNPDKGSWTWEPYPYLKRLRWQQNGIAFELSYFGMELEQADMLTIAESLK